MRWPADWSEWILALGIGFEVVSGFLIFVVGTSQQWITFPLIVGGLLLIAAYLLSRTLRLRAISGRFDSVTTLTFVQALLAVAFAVAEAALGVASSGVQPWLPVDVLRWAARLIAALFIGMVAIGLLVDISGNPPRSRRAKS